MLIFENFYFKAIDAHSEYNSGHFDNVLKYKIASKRNFQKNPQL